MTTMFDRDTWLHEDEVKQIYKCASCEKNEEYMEEAHEYLTSIVKQLYSREPINLLELESDLDELCARFEVKLIPGDLQISRSLPRKF